MACPHVSGANDLILEQCRDPSSNSNPEYFLTRHVNFDWTIDFNTKTISACVAYEMIPFDLYTAPDQMLVFDVKDLEIFKVCINQNETKWLITDGPHPHLGSCLKIHLPRQTESFTLHIEYRTSPQSSALQWLDAVMTADKQKPFLFTQCQSIHARSLFPCQDTPRVKFTYAATGANDLILEQCRDPSSNSNPEYFLTRHVNFDWTIDFNTKTISACVAYEMIPFDLYTAPDQMLVFDVKDLEIFKVCINQNETKWLITDGPHPHLGSCLKIHLPRQTESFTLHIEYRTSPQSSALQWLDAVMTADKQKPFLFTQCQSIHARSLFPCQDTPRVKFTYAATVRADPCMTVLMSAKYLMDPTECPSSGKPVHKFEQPIPVPSYLIALVCGDLRSTQIGPRSKVWAEPSVVGRAAFEFAEVDQMISAAERICGPYQWGNYDIVVLPPSFPYGGMENPCLTFVTPCLLAGDRSLICTIAHEVSHSWTGNLVTNASWENFWLNEGHTKYLEGLVLEAMYGFDYRELHIELGYEELQACLAEFPEGHPFTKLVPCLDGVHTDDYFSIIPYQKGSLLLYFLEQKYGKPAMLKWLRAYLDHFRGLSLSTRSWLDFLSKQLGTNVLADVNWNDWLYKTGAIPWVPKFTRKLSTVCDSVVSAITKEVLINDPNVAAFVRSTYEGLMPLQRQLVLQRLLERVPIHHDNLRVLDQMLQISQSKNSEIRYRWSLICLRSQYLPGLHSALEFLNSQGRMKFTRPIYKALMNCPSIAEQAISNFKTQRPNMHPTTAKLVAQDLGLA